MEMTAVLRVEEASQAGRARRLASELAERAGLGEAEIGRLATIVTEAATNLVKHASGGEILLGELPHPASHGLGLVAVDRGPGMASVEESLADGRSTRGTLGGGLGAIRRLSTAFDIYSQPGGTLIWATVDARDTSRGLPPLQAGAISVPVTGEERCGDAWVVLERSRGARAVVVDGLGHGALAHAAAATAIGIARQYPDDSLPELMQRLHQALQPTRGAAAAAVDLDLEGRQIRFCGVGNISGTIVDGTDMRHMVSHHGTLGHAMRHVREFTYPLPHDATLVLHSDGVGRWDARSYPGLLQHHPMLLAAALYRDCRRGRDDATVLVLRER